MNRVGVFLATAVLLAWAGGARAAEVVDLKTRPGVKQRILFLEAPAPVASVILLPGGSGKVLLKKSGKMKYGNNVLVRSRDYFAAQGFNVAVVDVPSDRKKGPGLNNFRESREHITDIKAVIAYLRNRAAVPVWAVGTSRGTLSAAVAGSMLGPPESGGIDGVVLMSSVTRGWPKRPMNLTDIDLGRIKAPVLIVHHRDDGCFVTPLDKAKGLLQRLTSAPEKEFIVIEGGGDPEDDNPCKALTKHGFIGQEAYVVKIVADWIKARR